MSAISSNYLTSKTIQSVRCFHLVPRTNIRPHQYSTAPLLNQKAKNVKYETKPRYKPTAIAQKLPRYAPTSRITSINLNPAIPYKTYAMSLAQKSSTTLLYTAPSTSAYYISSYTAAAFCFTYSTLSYWNNYLCAPPDIAVWIPYAFTGVSFATLLFGIRFLRNPLRMIQSISAKPKIDNNKSPTLTIEIELKRMIPMPFSRPKVISVAPHEISIPTPLYHPSNTLVSNSELRRQRITETLRRQQELEYERSHIMSAGIRHMWYGISKLCTSIFRATQRAFTRDKFLEMRINSKIYKLDLDGGWILDEGKAIDRLVKLEPSTLSRLVENSSK